MDCDRGHGGSGYGQGTLSIDAIVGGALGYFIAQQIYLRRRRSRGQQERLGGLLETKPDQEKLRNPPRIWDRRMSHSDSWVYPSL